MKAKSIDNAKLGAFVLAGMLFLIFSLYMIGRNRDLFEPTFSISANFRNVNGLMVGNNVRFSGIDVGTVKKIEIASDTSIRVVMIIDKKVRMFIKKNALASVGSDGLMGNKIININSAKESAAPVQDGDILNSLRPIEGDEMLRTLNTTNENMAVISTDLKRITQRINNSKGIWSLLSDTIIVQDIKDAAANIKHAGRKISQAGDEAADLLKNVQHGKGLAGAILSDSTLSKKLRIVLTNIQEVSEHSAQLTSNLNDVINRIKTGKGPVGTLVYDSIEERKLKASIHNIELGTQRFSEDMEALKQNFLFSGYFKKQEKEMEKEKKKSEKEKK